MTRRSSRLMVAATILIPVGLSPAAIAQDTYLGSQEFIASCAACHGITGKGDGEVAKSLTKKPADLTILAKMNGGEYPFVRVFEVIDGRKEVPAHGSRDMPVWGDRFEAELDASARHPLVGSEILVSSRINDLVDFIGSIQEK
jgi:mono/diheme cytochrome c family protein